MSILENSNELKEQTSLWNWKELEVYIIEKTIKSRVVDKTEKNLNNWVIDKI